MNEYFASYKISTFFKNIGFYDKCLGFYINGKLHIGEDISPYIHEDNQIILAPLWQQCIDWFRDNHKIMICLDFYTDDSTRFTKEDGKCNSFNEYFGDYVTNFTGINKGDMAYCTKTIRHKSTTFYKGNFYKVRAVDISGVNSMIRFNGAYAPFSLTRENISSLNFGRNMPFINDYFVNEIIGKALYRMIIRRFNRLILK